MVAVFVLKGGASGGGFKEGDNRVVATVPAPIG